MLSALCETASCSVWPGCSGTCESTSIGWPPIAIRTVSLPRTCRTWALITLPGCRTMGAVVAACAATCEMLGLMTIGIGLHFTGSWPTEAYRPVVKLSLTDLRIQCPNNAGSSLEIDQPRRAPGGDLFIHAPFFDVPVLIDMGGGPDLVLIAHAAQQRQCQQGRAGQCRHHVQ